MENNRRRRNGDNLGKEVEVDIFDKMDNLYEDEETLQADNTKVLDETVLGASLVGVETSDVTKILNKSGSSNEVNPRTGKPYKEEVIEPMDKKRISKSRKTKKGNKKGYVLCFKDCYLTRSQTNWPRVYASNAR